MRSRETQRRQSLGKRGRPKGTLGNREEAAGGKVGKAGCKPKVRGREGQRQREMDGSGDVERAWLGK